LSNSATKWLIHRQELTDFASGKPLPSMPRFAANLSTLYPEFDFIDRIGAAAHDGFEAVECQFPYEHDAADLARHLADRALPLVLMNAPPGDWARGDRGLAAVPGREAEFRRSVEAGLAYAQRVGCPRLHLLSGGRPGGMDANERAQWQSVYLDNLAWAAMQAAGSGITLLIEPINARDIPGYFLNRQEHAHEIVCAIDSPHLKVQMDLYHCQIVEGDLAAKLALYLPSGRVDHLQIAGVPDRHEPDLGEVNFFDLFERTDALDWAGYVGCEYRPRAGTREGLSWLRRARTTMR
jgi:hydroxypyruvate isomerase